MKKVFYFLCAFAVLASTSCQKAENLEQNRETPAIHYVFNITVANPDGDATKAVKTGWEEGDVIGLWLDDYNLEGSPAHFSLTYDGQDWIFEQIAGLVEFVDNGHLSALYKSDDMTVSVPLVLSCENVGYTSEINVDGSVEVTATLNDWVYETPVQIVVPGIEANFENYTLSCEDLSAGDGIAVDINSEGKFAQFSIANAQPGKAAAGVSNSDGAAFYFTGSEVSDAKAFTFVLSYNGKSYTYTSKSTTIYADGTSVKRVNKKLPEFSIDNSGNVASGCKWTLVGGDTPTNGFVKVTSEPEDWSGEYLLVYETESAALAFDGSLETLDAVSNTQSVVVEDGKIAATNEMMAIRFTVAKKTGSTDKYNIKSASGYYISGTTTSAAAGNGLKQSSSDDDYEITFGIESNNAVVYSQSFDQKMILRYNDASNQNRFRFYKSGQKAITLYKLVGEIAPAKALTSVAVSGTPTKTEYYVGDEFDPAGLVVTGTYDDESQATISSGITWIIDPETMAAATTSVSVTATVGEISSEAYTVTGLSVTTKPVTINLNKTLYNIEKAGENSIEQTTTTDKGITIVSGCTSSASSKTYYDSGHIRYYAGSYLKVSVDGTISKIAFTAGGTWNEDGISANTGTYQKKNWTGSASEVVFRFTKQCRVASIEVTYEIDTTPKYNVTCCEVEGGVLSASPSRAISGTVITLTATPKDDEYTFNNDWSVKGADDTSITVTDGTFTLPEQNVTVSGSFTKKTYTITKNAAEYGTYTVTDVDGASVTSASKGDKITLTASPADGYILNRWVVKDANDGVVSVSNNAFYMPASAVSISASFVAEAAVPEYASLEDLVEADLTSGTTVKVSFENVPIKSIYVSKGYRNGIYFDIQKGDKDIEIYYQNVPENWVVGGTVSGTMTCPWKNYSGTWELAPDLGTWDWENLAYTAPLEPCADPEITISETGSATISCATAGASIYYTVGTDPADPTDTSTPYVSAVSMTDGQTIKAIAYKDGMKASAVVEETYGQEDDQPMELTFDLSSNPGGWPTANSDLSEYTYKLDGEDYTFGLKNVKCNSGYLMLTSTAVLGLPAIEGMKLTKVVAKNSGGCSTSTKVGVSSSSSDATYINGGTIQTWSTTSTEYSYNLTETKDNTVYYLYVTNKNAQIVTLTLTYE